MSSCLMPECLGQAVGPDGFLCADHLAELASRRARLIYQNDLRAEVLRLSALRKYVTGTNRVLIDKDPTTPEPNDYRPAYMHRQAVAPAEAEIAEPVLQSMPCPVEKMPAGVKTAVKLAKELGYEHNVTIAIGPEPDLITSVAFRVVTAQWRVSSRHESKPGSTALGFKVAWRSKRAPSGNWLMPEQVGWRQLVAILKNEEVSVDERRALLDSMDTVGEMLGGTVVRVEAS